MQKLRRSWKLRTLAARFASHPRSFHVSRKVIAQARGLVNPSLVRLGRRGDYDIGRTLVIAGFPRSGTTWLAEMIAAVPGTGILFEPLDFQRLKAARLAGCDWDNFHLPEDTWREGEKYLAEVLAGRVLNGWTTAHLPCSRAWGVSRWIIKFVRANQMLAWLVSRFDILPPVFLIRHPCAVYASITRRGWPTFSYVPNPNSRFYRTYPQFRAVIKGLKTREELFAAQWCKHHYTALDRLDASRYQLCFYERLVTDGAAEVARILERWQLPVPAELERRVARPSAKASRDLQAGSLGQLDNWQGRIERGVTERMIDVLEQFGLNFYSGDPEPDYRWLPADLHPGRPQHLITNSR